MKMSLPIQMTELKILDSISEQFRRVELYQERKDVDSLLKWLEDGGLEQLQPGIRKYLKTKSEEKIPQTYKLHIQGLGSNGVDVMIDKSTTGKQVKEAIAKATGYPVEEQTLSVFQGSDISDNKAVYPLWKRGGGASELVNVSLTKHSIPVKIQNNTNVLEVTYRTTGEALKIGIKDRFNVDVTTLKHDGRVISNSQSVYQVWLQRPQHPIIAS